MSKVDDAKEILRVLGMPPAQQNDSAAYTLLAFCAVGPKTPWRRARAARTNPHGVIRFAREKYGKLYQENTRESIRRQAIHQFVLGGVLVRNPDDPGLATNSPQTHYAMPPEAIKVVRAFGSNRFQQTAAKFLALVGGGLASRYASPRTQRKVPVTLPDGVTLQLSPGKHNELQRAVVEEFLPRFTPSARVLYVGDTDRKALHVDEPALRALSLPVNQHDKLPDIVAHHAERNWVILIEVVASHGPVSPKRRDELDRTLTDCPSGRVYVSAFADFREFKRHAAEIAWDTEVWVAEAPSHLLHYNGDRFLGPR